MPFHCLLRISAIYKRIGIDGRRVTSRECILNSKSQQPTPFKIMLFQSFTCLDPRRNANDEGDYGEACASLKVGYSCALVDAVARAG